MEVMHKRGAGLDVHKADGCRLPAGDGGSQADAGVPDLCDNDGWSVGVAGVADGEPGHACRDGGPESTGSRCGPS